MAESILAQTFLFRFSAPLRRHAPIWSTTGVKLDESHTLPSFGELEGKRMFANLRAAWSERGLSFVLRVGGKSQPAWCRSSRPDDSDGLHLWLDTRDTHNIHRASRFCHRFVCLPFGGGRSQHDPAAMLLPINRARENPKPLTAALPILSRKQPGGYELAVHLPASVITGFDPAEHRRLGFTYAVADRELGWQTFTVGPEFPFQEDPSLWGTLELIDDNA
jgi:hypothetical protein